MVIGADQMIGSRLRRRVRTVGRVRRRLAESRIVGAERSVDFIGGNVQETERRAIRFRQRRPISARFFQQAECAVDVGANKIVGAVNGAVDMAFGGEMNDGARLFAPKQVAQTIAIDNVALLKAIARIAFDGSQVLEIAGIGQLVEIDDARALSEAIHWRMKFEPMKPAPPVTRMRSSMRVGSQRLLNRARAPTLIVIAAAREVVAQLRM